MRDRLLRLSRLSTYDFLANPYSRITALHPIVWVWGLSFFLIVIGVGLLIHTNTAELKKLKQAQASIAQYKKQLVQMRPVAATVRTSFVDDLPASVVPEDVLADFVQFSGKHDLKVVRIQPVDATTHHLDLVRLMVGCFALSTLRVSTDYRA